MKPTGACWKTSRNAKASPTRKDSPGRGRWHASAERGQWHGEAVTERLYRAAPALFRSLERRPLSNLSVSHPLDNSPCRGALGKEVSFSMKPICVCWKTSRDAKASHFERLPRPGEVARKCQKGARWHGEAVAERARMLTKSKNTAIQALFVRDIVSLCFRVLFCQACPLRR